MKEEKIEQVVKNGFGKYSGIVTTTLYGLGIITPIIVTMLSFHYTSKNNTENLVDDHFEKLNERIGGIESDISSIKIRSEEQNVLLLNIVEDLARKDVTINSLSEKEMVLILSSRNELRKLLNEAPVAQKIYFEDLIKVLEAKKTEQEAQENIKKYKRTIGVKSIN